MGGISPRRNLEVDIRSNLSLEKHPCSKPPRPCTYLGCAGEAQWKRKGYTARAWPSWD
jgi:hypothetical protein